MDRFVEIGITKLDNGMCDIPYTIAINPHYIISVEKKDNGNALIVMSDGNKWRTIKSYDEVMAMLNGTTNGKSSGKPTYISGGTTC